MSELGNSSNPYKSIPLERVFTCSYLVASQYREVVKSGSRLTSGEGVPGQVIPLYSKDEEDAAPLHAAWQYFFSKKIFLRGHRERSQDDVQTEQERRGSIDKR